MGRLPSTLFSGKTCIDLYRYWNLWGVNEKGSFTDDVRLTETNPQRVTLVMNVNDNLRIIPTFPPPSRMLSKPHYVIINLTCSASHRAKKCFWHPWLPAWPRPFPPTVPSCHWCRPLGSARDLSCSFSWSRISSFVRPPLSSQPLLQRR